MHVWGVELVSHKPKCEEAFVSHGNSAIEDCVWLLCGSYFLK